MNPITKFKNVLRRLKQQWGKFGTKARMWDAEYAGGRWNHCERTPGAYVYDFVEKYCANGSVLDLGCGSGNTGNELSIQRYGRYVGVDVSEVACQKAATRSQQNGRADKNRYETGDIVSYVPSEKYNVILFRESIYYVPLVTLKSVLLRYAPCLMPDGAFVVNVSKHATKRYQKYYDLIQENFAVLEKYSPPGTDDFVVVFRCRGGMAPAPLDNGIRTSTAESA